MLAQYRAGTASAVTGQTAISGVGTLWAANASKGNLFCFVSESVWYTIDSVTNDGEIVLETPYVGATKTGEAYAIHRNFTGSQSYPYPSYGDINTGSLLQIAVHKVDAQMQYLASAPLNGSTTSPTFTIQRDAAGTLNTDAGIVVSRGSAASASILFRDSQTNKRWEFFGFSVGKIGNLQVDGNVGIGQEPGTKKLEVTGAAKITGDLEVASINGLTLAEIKGVSAYADLTGKPTLGSAAAKNVGTGANDVAAGNHTHAAVTTSVNGFMSSADKLKLNNIALSSGLADTTITTPAIGQILRFNGTKWINHTLVFANISDGASTLTSALAPYATTASVNSATSAINDTVSALNERVGSAETAIDLRLRFDASQTLSAGQKTFALGNLGVSTYAQTLLDDANASTALTTLGVSTYAKTLLDDANASTALSTLGVTTYAKTLLDDADASTALSTLGVSTYAKTLLGAADVSTAQTTLGISTFAKTLLDDADAPAMRTTLGAQAALGYTPVNRAGDSAMTGNFVTQGTFVGNNTTPVSGTISGGAFRSDTSGAGSQFAQFYCQNQIGVAIRAALLSINGAQVGSLTVDSGGNTAISGSLSKASGTFLIDHPLDPYNKDLAHGFVEAPEYQNRYRGLVRLVDGRATVDIDTVAGMSTGTFAALNADAWVAGLQNQEGFARLRPGTLTGGIFEIICEDDACTDLVAWEVTARRNDAYVRSGSDPNTDSDGKFICEQEKPE